MEILGFATVFAAAVSDIRKKKIPNYLILAGAFFYLILVLAAHDFAQGAKGIFLFFFVIAVSFPLFLLRAVGAGDIKLFALLAAICEGQFFLNMLVLFCVFSGLGAIIILYRERATEHKERLTMILSPFLLAAYSVVFIGRWCQLC